jgi:23S rRNA G2069 N7-methylase RlmK/C1962 C5-methylase RlmI
MNINLVYLKTTLNKYTFTSKTIRLWVEKYCKGKRVLNLFAGKTQLLGCYETRNDIDTSMEAEYHLDALDFVYQWKGDKFDIAILDPPYSYRKSMEMYHGHKASRFNQVKDNLPSILIRNGEVITFGYHSVSMGKVRNYIQKEILLMSHGGAIHDTIAVLEVPYSSIHINIISNF